MAASAWIQAGLARALFYPTLLYTVFRGKVRGPAHRDWYHRIDHTVLLGALPLRGMTHKLIQEENVRGVITMNEEYETRFLCNSSKFLADTTSLFLYVVLRIKPRPHACQASVLPLEPHPQPTA
ncbi:phosphatidylglycerophosphatase and protein-tyrosine phosphatase 1 isoform X2 [Marmota marmota marmota]|uniref:phosphatidylglycerophosphatase and protein-tyrosine phosphatase 1 isoform X2 n=1 Tax=Marmota marmota marmota TaxID=9994 RepID=UPI0020922231|nr:phosphatidylglycerophosphatase and protein-tyrosine phosphatase 1 isoform X2 [Marmota marmota marmota]